MSPERKSVRAVDPSGLVDPADPSGLSLTALMRDAAAEITRWEPRAAWAATREAGARLIDIRSELHRERDGIIPGALHIPRNVLEWRVAVDSPYRLAEIGGREETLVLFCDHGYSTILAARSLVALGFRGAGDVVGGFAGWQANGLPVQRLS